MTTMQTKLFPQPGTARPASIWTAACVLIALLLSASAVWAQSLAVYPPRAHLEDATDQQRLVVVHTRADGVTQDVTAEVTAAFSAGGIADWTEELLLKPLADGESELTLSFGEESVTVPVRVENASVTPPVSFRNDVLAVILRGDCNTGGCHGSEAGQNGFHLSLFGYDPDSDYLNLTRDALSRRLNMAVPDESLVLLKATGAVDHEGGTRFDEDSPLYRTLHRWIAEGAEDDAGEAPSLTGIEIFPEEAVLEQEGARQRFVVIASYSDGATADVTELAILSASDENALSVDGGGVATAGEKGETYLMARFGTFAVVSQVIVLDGEPALEWPEDAVPHNYIDGHIFDKLTKLRIPPAALASDSVFLRRVYLDVIGMLPSIEETQAFLDDPDPDKRARIVDELLERPQFSEVWAMKWAEVLRVSTGNNTLDVKAMHRYNDWLRQAINANTPLDELVRQLLTAQGGNFTNPAANFYVVERDPTLVAENVAQVFMGVQISCAQCHNHPFERWTMDDYYSFSAFFSQVGRKTSSDPRESIIFDRGRGEVRNLRDNEVMAPRFLGGEQPDINGRDRREVLADWLTSAENPWFAKNIANRVWDHFFGAGIIDPADDVRVTNPPSNPALLEELGQRMLDYDYDLRQLVRDICNSYTYQMSTRPREPDIHDTRNFAFAQLRRMTAEQMLDAISTVTQSTVKFPNLPEGSRAVEVADGNSGVYFLEVFGRPSRDTVCTCERRNEPTLAQSLHLINGATINEAIKSPGGLLDQLLEEELDTGEVLDKIYLAALARPASEEEVQILGDYVASAEDRRAALEDAFWSVLNSKAFIFNH